ARSDAPTAMLGALGDDDFGRERRADLEAEGIDTESVARRAATPSGVALIVVEEATGQNRIAYVPGATRTIAADQARAAVERVNPAVVLATLEPPEEALAALFDAARQRGSLAQLGPATVAVTLGASGVAIVHDGETATYPAPSVEVVDTTGAGDAFCGAFAAELARGADAFSAARTGVVAGSLATTVRGAYPGIPHRAVIDAVLVDL
ncbi:MAG: rbsK, partial [Thermomicrobiales bacterium]|nr:rbsK [Thermomicrobiales bacterium]